MHGSDLTVEVMDFSMKIKAVLTKVRVTHIALTILWHLPHLINYLLF